MRDTQRSKVYAWEHLNVHKKYKDHVPYANIQNIVNYVWEREGLKHPPLVMPLDKRNKKAAATGNRLGVEFPEKGTTTAIILHELSHSMTGNFDEETNMHGDWFMGVYIQLLTRYLGMKYNDLMWSAIAAGLKVEINAKPVFI